LGGGLNGLQVLGPSVVGRNPTGKADGIQRGVVLAHATEHSRDNRYAFLPQDLRRISPERWHGAQWIKGELNSVNAGGAQFSHQIKGIGWLERPRTDGQSFIHGGQIHYYLKRFITPQAKRFRKHGLCEDSGMIRAFGKSCL
jgi:hypothetical protein